MSKIILQESEVVNKFIGVWELVDYKIEKEDGSFYSYPYGVNCKGTIIYTKEGRMTALLMDPDRPTFQINHSWRGTAEEMKQAFRRYTSYSGMFKIVNNTVVHQVDRSLFPNWIGTDLIRVFEFINEEKQLILSTAPFDAGKAFRLKHVLLWKRV